MSANSPKNTRALKSARNSHVVTPQEVTDPSILESVAGFINEVVPNSYTTFHEVSDQILWAHFEQLEFTESSFISDTDCEKTIPPPIILVLGYSTGIQVWCIQANGEAIEILGWKHGTTKVLRILPSPQRVEGDCDDLFLSKRPLMALCDGTSPGPPFCSLSFLSLKTGEQVKVIKFKSPIIDVCGNKTSIVVTFSGKIAVFDAFTLEDRCTVTTCYVCPGINPNPIALGCRWLAYADKTLTSPRKSSGGCDSEGVQSYTATVMQCARSLSKGIKEFGESVANSFTGNATFKPGVVGPSSPQFSGVAEGCQKGVVTIIDIGNDQIDGTERNIPEEAIIAHFIAHNEAIVSLEFDNSGMLLATADNKGHDFHIFKIYPHSLGSNLASVQHLYILHRGDTTAKVQDMCFSPDSRWVTVSTLRGTTHVFPITPYGGSIGIRTHTTQHVVNRMSRFHRSAGLTDDQRSNSPVSGLETTTGSIYPYANPRFTPYPHPTVVQPLAQIRQPVLSQPIGSVQPRITSIRPRLPSHEDPLSLGVVACFAPPRAYMDTPGLKEIMKKPKPVESLFIMGCHGSLIQYDLEPYPISSVPKERLCDDTPIELKTFPRAQWILQRQPNVTDVPLPISVKYLEHFIPREPMRNETFFDENDDHWLSQVEIVTHAGPHRRLWMGPQFVFKTYTIAEGKPFCFANIQQVDLLRSKPVNMPDNQNAVFIECGSANSRELSPPMTTYHTTFDEVGGLNDLQLREDLADAMLESPGIRDNGGCCVIVSMKSQATPVAKVVNPLGTVVTIQSDEETETEQCEDVVIHENCDESLFRPIVTPKPILFSDGKPRTNATNTMIVKSLDDATEVAVKILNKSGNVDSTTNKKHKHIFEQKNRDSTIDFKILNANTKKIIEEDADRSYRTTVEMSNKLLPSKVEDEPVFSEPSVFEESQVDFKDDFDMPCLDHRNDTDRELEFRTDMFEDASDCYDDLLYINPKIDCIDKVDNIVSEERVAQLKPRKPKTKLGVRIPNKNFPMKNEEDIEPLIAKRSWSSIAALKPKEKVVDVSEKENCEIFDNSDERSVRKPYNSSVKTVKLIHIDTPVNEEAAIEIIEPILPEYRKNSWYSSVLEKSSDEEKIIDVSPGETTESDDSGKVPENNTTEDCVFQNVIQTVTSKVTKKKSKKKRK